ncbi:MAG: UDP-N-acetylmuramate dehydrogenase [Bacteroidales bacterium]|jgi:UDP-N-acetylmuramate dehydrogenase
MNITENKQLQNYNTFKVNAISKYFAEIENKNDLLELFKSSVFINEKKFILGEGANVLFKNNFDGLIIHSKINFINKIEEDNNYVFFNVGSGTIWNDFLKYTLDLNLSGLENLIDIPGQCGSAIVQNIGAYGVEIKNCVEKVNCINLEKPYNKTTLSKEECKFGYRDSIFKHDFKNYFITDITLKLNKKYTPILTYKELAKKYHTDINNFDSNTSNLTPQIIASEISQIRERKLPNYKKIYNAGSFFKNPIVDEQFYKTNLLKYNLVTYPAENNKIKLSAAQLIEQAELKGYRIKDAAVSNQHSLVLCNYGSATGEEIYDVAKHVVNTVCKKFGVKLQPETIIL